MNPKQQKTHRTVTADVAQRLEDFALAMEERLDTSDRELMRQTGLILQERAARLKLADEQRAYVDRQIAALRLLETRSDNQDATLLALHVAFMDRGLWQRLNWIMRGR